MFLHGMKDSVWDSEFKTTTPSMAFVSESFLTDSTLTGACHLTPLSMVMSFRNSQSRRGSLHGLSQPFTR